MWFWICIFMILAVILASAIFYVFSTERPDPVTCIIGVPPK